MEFRKRILYFSMNTKWSVVESEKNKANIPENFSRKKGFF